MKRKIIGALVVAAFAALAPARAVAQTVERWQLVYENDASGSAVSGSLSELAAAVQNGYDVKIVLHEPGGWDWQLQLAELGVNPDRSVVTGFVHNEIANPAGTDVYERLITLNTKGEYTLTYEQNPYYSKLVLRWPMSWYVSK